SDLADVRGLGALGALDHVELHLLALSERPESLGLDGGMMDEDVRAALARDEAKTLCVVEPLHFASFHVMSSCLVRRRCAPYFRQSKLERMSGRIPEEPFSTGGC